MRSPASRRRCSPPLPGPRPSPPCEFRIRWADSDWERREAMALRRAVFCFEQGVFVGDDRDAIDDHAQCLVALSMVGGAADAVVGTVRIHRAEPGVWWGSRLAVHPSFRHLGRIGATLIKLAVSSAHAQGCGRFLAHVQSQNVPMFERLYWTALEAMNLHGRPHHRMQADLAHYPPCDRPYAGFVTRTSA
ncbi:MSMEG_0567/Sll0786 family nitrogen starvation N-acetyltransferase [Aquabacterium sp. J223]|uniref:MSMEG_0567/Sll0786 family nitrogen starvation N-acetyltransferase n=1 Tax=Aquabacterium sp. J223 TaxID=2898431 RepID=UPI00391745B8